MNQASHCDMPVPASLSRIVALVALLATGVFTYSAGERSAGSAPMAMMVSTKQTSSVGFRFPTIRGDNLEGRSMSLPDDLEGRARIVIVAFQRWHQNLVDTWVPVARALEHEHPGLSTYEIPTLPRMNPFSRFFIDNGMRGGIPDRNVRAHTVTLYTDKDRFRAGLGIGDERDIHLFLLDETGRVVWRGEGPRAAQTEGQLRQSVASLLAPTNQRAAVTP